MEEEGIQILLAIKDELTGGLARAGAAISAFSKDVQAEFKHLEEAAKGIKGVWNDIFDAVIGAEIAKSLFEVADATEHVNDRMLQAAASAEAMGQAFNMEEAKKWVSEFADYYGQNVDKATNAYTKFIALGATPNQSKRLTTDAENASKKFGIPFEQAQQIIERAMTRSVAALERFGAKVKDSNGQLVTFAQGMQMVEDKTRGAADAMSDNFEASMNRLGNTMKDIRNNFGEGLIKDLQPIANAVDHISQAFKALPEPVNQAIAGVAIFIVGLLSLSLILPSVAKGTVMLVNGVKALWGAFGVVAAAAGISTGALALLLAALAALGVLVREVIVNWSDLATQVKNACKVMADEWGMMATGFGQIVKDMGDAWQGFTEILSGNIIKGILDVNKSFDNMGTHFHKTVNDMKWEWDNYTKHQDQIGARINKRSAHDLTSGFGLFTSTKPAKPETPDTDLSNLGNNKNTSAVDHSAKDAIEALKSDIADALEHLSLRVEVAKGNLEDSKNAYSAYVDALPDQKPKTADQDAQLTKLANDEKARELALQQAITAKKQEELHAAQQLEEAAKTYAGIGKTAQDQARDRAKTQNQLRNDADRHRISAATDDREVKGITATIRKLFTDLRKAIIDGAMEALKQSDDARAENESLQGDKTQGANNLIAHKLSMRGAYATQGEVDDAAIEQARNNAAQTLLGLNDAKDALAELQATGQRLGETFRNSKPYTDALRVAEENLAKARLADTSALYRRTEARATKDAHQAQNSVQSDQLLQGLALKAGVPGLSANGAGALAFNPTTFLIDAISKTKAFGDVMNFVGQIVKIVGQIFEALRPILDLVLTIVASVVNVFIDLYNMVARLLSLLGLHVKLLDKINTNFQQMDNVTAPFISILHDIPTQNELATGKVSTISTTWNNSLSNTIQNAQQPIVDGLNSGFGGVIGVLGSILGGILALKGIMAVFGGGGGLSSLFGGGGGGGIGGFIKGIGGFLGTNVDSIGGIPINQTVGSMGLEALGGALIGSAHLFGGNQTNSTIGGGIGGLVGGIAGAHLLGMLGSFAGPVGAIGGALLGSLIGSMFGPKLNAQNAPDIFSTGTYGQEMADLGGSGGVDSGQAYMANGQAFTENSQMAQALGGHGEEAYIGNYIKQTGGKGLDPALVAEFNNASGFSYLKDGQVQLNNGYTAHWDQVVGDAQNAIKQISTAMQSSASSITGAAGGITVSLNQNIATLNQLAQAAGNANGNLQQVAKQAGSSLSTGNGLRSTTSDAAIAAINAAMSGVAGTANNISSETHIYNPTINGYDDIEALYKDMSKAQDLHVRAKAHLFGQRTGQ